MNAHQTNRYADRLLVLYQRNLDSTCRQVINTEWSAAWADLFRQYDIRLKERLWRDDYNGMATPNCPECNGISVIRHHHAGNAMAPECDYWACEICGAQWGHE